MSDSESRSFGSLLCTFALIITLAIFLVPSIASADPFLMLHNESNLPQLTEVSRLQPGKSAVTVGVNDNGDLTIRHRDVSLIVAYNPPNEFIDPQERIRIAHRMDCPTINGISLKVSMLF